jgi:uncharacterized protein
VQDRVADINAGGLVFEFNAPAERFPALLEFHGSHAARFQTPVRMRGRAQKIADLIEIEGEISTTVELECSRCLCSFRNPLTISYALTFSRELPGISSEQDDDEVELSPEEMGLIPFAGDELALDETVQEQLLMALPLQPLCRPECRGLCPNCGTDLNLTSCGCEPPVFNARFAALEKLKTNKE